MLGAAHKDVATYRRIRTTQLEVVIRLGEHDTLLQLGDSTWQNPFLAEFFVI